jgi:hypothetical protein
MSVFVEIKNVENLRKARILLGAKSDNETVELALEYFVKYYERHQNKTKQKELDNAKQGSI